MFNNFFNDTFERLSELPREIGTEAVAQVKPTKQQTASPNNQTPNPNQQAKTNSNQDPQYQHYLKDLYGVSGMTPQQEEQKRRQDLALRRQAYQKIQQDIMEYRAKKKKEKTKYEIGWQPFDSTARTQEEEMEMWEKQQKEAAKKKKEQERAQLPGSAAKRSGEQGKIMG